MLLGDRVDKVCLPLGLVSHSEYSALAIMVPEPYVTRRQGKKGLSPSGIGLSQWVSLEKLC